MTAEVAEVAAENAEFVIATRNPGKIKEAKKMLSGLSAKLFSLANFPNAPEVRETGKTLEENAVLKASSAAKHTKKIAVAEDSGFLSKHLKESPASAQRALQASAQATRSWWKKLLNLMRGKKNRKAEFQAVVAIAKPSGETKVVGGKCFGKISLRPIGRAGFGFDPVFVPHGFRKTFAELGLRTKNKVSHRAKAFAEAKKILEKLLSRK